MVSIHVIIILIVIVVIVVTIVGKHLINDRRVVYDILQDSILVVW